MKQVLLYGSTTFVALGDVGIDIPIFVKDVNGKLCGMLVKEDAGWVVRLGGDLRLGLDGGERGAQFMRGAGRRECMEYGSKNFGFTYHVEL